MNQVKKIIRDDAGELTDARKEKIIDELGDVLWYCAAVASDLGINWDEVIKANLQKLTDRGNKNLIRGDQRK